MTIYEVLQLLLYVQRSRRTNPFHLTYKNDIAAEPPTITSHLLSFSPLSLPIYAFPNSHAPHFKQNFYRKLKNKTNNRIYIYGAFLVSNLYCPPASSVSGNSRMSGTTL